MLGADTRRSVGSPILTVVAVGLAFGAGQSANRVAAIHRQVVFVDMHAHPSHFHRANVSRIEPDELARYRRGLMDVVVCNISTDARSAAATSSATARR